MIYFDNAATTKMDSRVVDAMLPYMNEYYGNPSAVYGFTKECKEALAKSRQIIAQLIGAEPEEIIFTSGGSESDNLALKGTIMAGDKRRHMIASKIEHHAIINSCLFLKNNGFHIDFADVDEYGEVSFAKIKRLINDNTKLVSVMAANNEVGTIQPIKEIGEKLKDSDILFHTDAVQFFGHERLNVNDINADMVSASAHKFNGPKGVGFLYVRKGTHISPLINGGAQEYELRAGTENVAGIVGMATAAQLAYEELGERGAKVKSLRDYFVKRVLSEIPYTRLNGHPIKRLDNNANISFQFVDGGAVVVMLSMKGICASSGSACSSGSKDASHVLLAMGLPEEIARGAVRFTFGSDNTVEEIDYAVEELKDIIMQLRKISPEYREYSESTKN